MFDGKLLALMGLLHRNLEVNECLVTKCLLTNVTKINKHSNVTFTHVLAS